MVMDRINALRRLASSNGNKYVTEDPDLLAEVGTEKELIRRQFFAEVEEIRERIEKLQANVEEVKLKHSAILTAWNINEEMNNELEDFQADMKETFNETIEMLKHMEQSIEIEVERQSNKIGADSSNLNRPKNKSANLRMRITQHAALWHKFVEVMTEYNSAQADYRDRCENWKLRQLAITHQNVSEQELKTLLEQNNPSLFTNGVIRKNFAYLQFLRQLGVLFRAYWRKRRFQIIMETQQARETLADLEARYAHVMQLETSIRELHDMFIDMAMLTETQGEMVNRIEFHVNNSVENIEDGLDDVEDAVNIVYSNRRVNSI
ncbi:syntaxin-1A-like isoform X2 [Choristoneura fumiferana]|uniref:syntaxin-1A-like isoform X2 n=1 Tax=Choristoneura fumiferana TaxID=7141 RepID=UPI003D15D0E9